MFFYITLYTYIFSPCICVPGYMHLHFCRVCMYHYLYTYPQVRISVAIQKSPENGKKETFVELIQWRRAADFGAKTKPWVTVAYHTDIKCLKFQIVMLNSVLTFHMLILCVSAAFYLGWSFGYVSWKMLSRMCSKVLLSVRKGVPGNLWWAIPRANSSHVLALPFFLLPHAWLSANTNSIV